MEQNQKGSKSYLISIVMVAVLGGLLFGYDTAVISGAEKGLQAFFLNAPDFIYTDGWHGFTCASALVGCIIGSGLSGFFASNLGRKKSLILAGMLFFISALGSMEPEFLLFNHGEASFSLLIMFNIYRVIGGVGVGLASAICPMYIAEVAPSNIRGTLVSWNQFAIIFGQLVVYFVNFIILGNNVNPVIEALKVINPDEAAWTISTGWRYMFGSEAVPAGLFALLICFVPETPRYLVMIGQDNKALAILQRINGKSEGAGILDDIRNTITEKTEKLLTYGWLVIFIGIMLSVFQQAVGINAVLYYAPRIFGDMGMTNPMVNTVMMGIVNILFTLVAIFSVEKWGRKPLLIYGSIGMAIGAFGVAATFGNPAMSLITMISIMVYSASFMFSWGPICWVLIAEIFPNTIRGKAVAIAVAFQWIFNWIVSSTFVPMFNMQLGNDANFGHWFTYGLYGIICALAAVFVWKLVPETKGKTLEDMTNLWKKN
ncbi:D-xylose transporter XylE [Xylanibacter muris]|uniref:D-xylose transporter XylE n=1 Tax=Xylanibacter muris TaxID=2736290 RepID=A0ABX2ALU2_9BACT|nr:D-xylose transporter XylE [Xylanibacter muris]NPD91989.1 D-xylose transporter XylE [Xylanibacter muris]